MNDADTPSTAPPPHPPSLRKDLRSFRRDWCRWSSAERRAATLVLVFVAASPMIHLLP